MTVGPLAAVAVDLVFGCARSDTLFGGVCVRGGVAPRGGLEVAGGGVPCVELSIRLIEIVMSAVDITVNLRRLTTRGDREVAPAATLNAARIRDSCLRSLKLLSGGGRGTERSGGGFIVIQRATRN